ncbi:Glucose--fructose oxidoreductase precursor [Pseudovibrio axinellae]|uniref:Glucose--fructose oxidoreductase n=1 Tax=Pseudovibrio axinellae TaxID=989403 RepID=A0A165XY35_9HYPH|nr:Gfo/Idh/MocA family oxidoreductase [Pseudovibrio axinellae]KZL18236.1 Glucose--fructose oxidoreductase precursor [Pseudovibrio axinellae]SER71689.1 Predicted dehydrogenase [Pseudovibrio axinellae]
MTIQTAKNTIEVRAPATLSRRLRLGMVGGGEGAFIGGVHRIASRIDDRYELVAGALSSDPERARSSGAKLHIAPERVYPSFEEMAQKEQQRSDPVDVVAIVTPNHVHYRVARTMLEAGFHVICDKPMTTSVEDSARLLQVVQDTGKLFLLTHNYTGYPMVRQAREMVAQGTLGNIRIIQVEYPQDWLTERLEATGQKQASWRTDPNRAGVGGCIGDIGTHAYNLATFVSGLKATEVLGELTSFVEGRALDDDVQILLRYENGAKGTLWASQIAPGNENGLRLRVYGDKGGLEWAQEDPNFMKFTPFGQTTRLITRNGAGASSLANAISRIPGGHPEGYLEAFATLYNDFAEALSAHLLGLPEPDITALLPGVEDGLDGLRFIETAVNSSSQGGVWQKL